MIVKSNEERLLLRKIERLKKIIIKIIETNNNDIHHPSAKKLDDELERCINEYHELYQIAPYRKEHLSHGDHK